MDTTTSPVPQAATRRHDLDWIRVGAFWLLIVFHVALAFTDQTVYPYRNRDTGGAVLDLLLNFLHQWRLPVLFMISGMGTSFAFRRRTGWKFVGERSKRLLIPLVFGMLVVNLPIGFFAARWLEGVTSIGSFAIDRWWLGLQWLDGAAHLWFLVNLFVYSVLLAPLFVWMRNRPDGSLARGVERVIRAGDGYGLLFLVPLPLVAVELLIKPILLGFTGQGYEFFWYLVFFFVGYLLIAVGDSYWTALARIRYPALIVAIVAFLLLTALTAIADGIEPGYGFLVQSGGWTAYGVDFLTPITGSAAVVHALNSWAWCMVVFSWGAKYLSQPSKRLGYLNQSVYPFYIVHMPVILVTLFYVKSWEILWPLKLVGLTVLTFAACWAIFEIVKRTAVTRAVFGIKPLPQEPKAVTT